MSNTNTISTPISVYNYTSNESLTGYCLPISIFKFVALDYFNTNNVYWEFGDGTNSSGLTAYNSYNVPGTYDVNCFFYDISGNVYKCTDVKTLSVVNFVTDSLVLSSVYDADCITDELLTCLVDELYPELVLVSEPLTYYTYTNAFTAGRINTITEADKINILRSNSWQTWNNLSATGYDLSLKSKGGTENFFDQSLETNKYGNLYPYSSFYNKVDDEFVETQTTQTDNTLLYCKLSGGTINFCSSGDYGSVFCGTSGIAPLYFKDDLPYSTVILYVNFSNGTFYDIENFNNNLAPYYSNYFNSINTIAVGLCSTIGSNHSYDKLSITSTGLDGEGSVLTAFNIDTNKFVNSPINFIIKVKTNHFFDDKSIPILSAGTGVNGITIAAINESNDTVNLGVFTSNFSYLSSLTGGGFYKGKIIPILPYDNIRLSAYGNINGSNINGVSNTFNVYPSSGKYNLAKINEDFDFGQINKDLIFQEFLLDDTVLFDEFLPSIYGNLSAKSDSLGKTANEKIANFVANKVDINQCDIDSLVSLNLMLDSNIVKFDQNNFNNPAKFKKLVDLVSINHSRLWGTTNKFNLNFSNQLGSDTEAYGLNLGSELDIYTSVLTAADKHVVALEKFSGNYKLCSTYVVSSYLTEYTYISGIDLVTFPLSSYSEIWGWGLATAGLSGTGIHYYYRFFEYVNVVDDTIVNNIINFDDVVNTVDRTLSSYSSWVNDSGIVDNLLIYNLYTGVKLLSA